MNCDTKTPESDCKSVEKPKRRECDKNLEIEKIKRQLYNLIDRVEQLKDK